MNSLLLSVNERRRGNRRQRSRRDCGRCLQAEFPPAAPAAPQQRSGARTAAAAAEGCGRGGACRDGAANFVSCIKMLGSSAGNRSSSGYELIAKQADRNEIKSEEFVMMDLSTEHREDFIMYIVRCSSVPSALDARARNVQCAIDIDKQLDIQTASPARIANATPHRFAKT